MAKNMTVQVPPSPTGIYTISVGAGGGGGTSMGSINKQPSHLIDPSVLDHFIKDHEIQGHTLIVEHRESGYVDISRTKEADAQIKGLLLEKLIHEMFKAKHIEFTQMRKPDTDEMVYRARIHVVPDTQVRIIRELKNAKT